MTCGGQTDWVGFVVPQKKSRSKSRGVPRMCVGEVESCEKSGNILEISLIKQ